MKLPATTAAVSPEGLPATPDASLTPNRTPPPTPPIPRNCESMSAELAPVPGRKEPADRLTSRRPAGRIAFRLSVPPVSGVLRPRSAVVCLVLAVVAFLAFCVETAVGDISLSVTDVMRALVGAGDPGTELIVHELRLPRSLAGLLVGIAFGVSGALLQAMTHNPLASPDMMGITQGAGAAVVAGIVLGWDDGPSTQALGLLGALAAALLVYVLAWKRGTTGYRIVLVGVGVAWICTSVTDYLMARGQRFQAQAALGWLVGNLNGRTWQQIGPLAVTTAVLVPVALLLGRPMRTLELGDDVARGLGRACRPSGWPCWWSPWGWWRSGRRPRGRWRSWRWPRPRSPSAWPGSPSRRPWPPG